MTTTTKIKKEVNSLLASYKALPEVKRLTLAEKVENWKKNGTPVDSESYNDTEHKMYEEWIRNLHKALVEIIKQINSFKVIKFRPSMQTDLSTFRNDVNNLIKAKNIKSLSKIKSELSIFSVQLNEVL